MFEEFSELLDDLVGETEEEWVDTLREDHGVEVVDQVCLTYCYANDSLSLTMVTGVRQNRGGMLPLLADLWWFGC